MRVLFLLFYVFLFLFIIIVKVRVLLSREALIKISRVRNIFIALTLMYACNS